MEASEILASAKVQALKDIEALLKNQVNVVFDSALELAAGKVKETIPGQVDDAIIDMVVAAAGPQIKALVMAQIEKISAA